MSEYPKEVLVYLDFIPHRPQSNEKNSQGPQPTLIGSLRFEAIHNRDIASFEYDASWLARKPLTLDPDIYPFAGRQYPPEGKPLFGVFSDSCPDRWGRMLLLRSEGRRAKAEDSAARTLAESDYLLGIDDYTRMGAIRYVDPSTGGFLAPGGSDSVPPLKSIRTLEEATRAIENNEETSEALAAVNLLLSPGSSLGGARPKANVKDEHGELWIAKFPSKSDAIDVGLAEAFACNLADQLGVTVCETDHAPFGRYGTTFLSKRFDRSGSDRLLFSSSMAQLGLSDGASSLNGVGYSDIAEFIRSAGESPGNDLRELFRRIVFSIAISNTDDHFRNHGFLYGSTGWRLSPAFDLNPNPSGRTLTLGIDGQDASLSFSLARATAPYYELSDREAVRIIEDAKLLLKDWEARAKRFGLKAGDINALAPAFDTSWKS